jgi:hypothetical protein
VSKIAKIKKAVAALSPVERHELVRWLEVEESNHGDLSEKALSELGDEAFQALKREESLRACLRRRTRYTRPRLGEKFTETNN